MTILITGGTGKTGSALARILAEKGQEPVVASRSASGASTVHFDWLDEATHDAALKGVKAAYLVAPAMVADPAPIMAAFIDRARAAGVRRFVLLSASSIPEGGPAMGEVHAKLAREGGEWAVMRPSWFMQNFTAGQHLPTIREDNAIYTAAEDGRVPFIDADDIAAVAAAALTMPEAPNRDIIVTGPEAISYDRVAALVSAACGREVRHVRLSFEEMSARWQALGLGPDYANMLTSMDVAIAGGAEDRITDEVASLTGRPPISFEKFAQKNAQIWA